MQNKREKIKGLSDKPGNMAPKEPTGSHWRTNKAIVRMAAKMGEVSPCQICTYINTCAKSTI